MNAGRAVARNIGWLRVKQGLAAKDPIDRTYVSQLERELLNLTVCILEKVALPACIGAIFPVIFPEI